VYVVGGGDAAIEDALALARFTDQVNLVVRRDSLRASKIMQERVLDNPKIKVIWNTTVAALQSENGALHQITLKNLVNGQEDDVQADGLFYAIGHAPATKFLGDFVTLNKEGYVVTRFALDAESVQAAQANIAENGRVAYPTMTSREGVFAAGDNVDFVYRQAITAAGFGTMAALDVERWLERQG
jgi:thioredoxin reductase (NADPH)